MANYDYREAIRWDVEDYIRESIDLDEWKGRADELADYLNEELWTEDSVTGNASGSYTFSTYEAEENLSHNWHLIEELANEWGIEPTISDGYEHGAEWWDVSIRCYLLGECINEALEEFKEELEEEEEEQTDNTKHYLCEHCISALRSRGEPVWESGHYIDEDEAEEEGFVCEWCEEVAELHEVIW